MFDPSILVGGNFGPDLVARPKMALSIRRWHTDRLSTCDPSLQPYATSITQRASAVPSIAVLTSTVVGRMLADGGLVDRALDFNAAIADALATSDRQFPHEEFGVLVQGLRDYVAEVWSETNKLNGADDDPMSEQMEFELVRDALTPWRARYPNTLEFSPSSLDRADPIRWRSPKCPEPSTPDEMSDEEKAELAAEQAAASAGESAPQQPAEAQADESSAPSGSGSMPGGWAGSSGSDAADVIEDPDPMDVDEKVP